jgi:AcrR family transcriptional regulator
MPRTQAERREATSSALMEAARELFAQDGYAATSLDAVVAAAAVTKGALYHHFAGKRELFAAVFASEQERLSRAIVAAYANGGDDPWVAFEAGCRAFVEASQEPGVQRIVLLDAPVALGWETIRRLEAGALSLMELGLQRAIDDGRIAPRPTRPLAHLLFGALCESAMMVAREPDPSAALKAATKELGELLHGLSTPSRRSATSRGPRK